MVYPPTQGNSCAFTHTIPLLDGILTSLLCPSMSTLFWVMNSIPKMQSIPLKVETNKSTFPHQFLSWRGTSFTCNVVGWGTPSTKCTSTGASNFSNWSSILSALSRILKLWKALVSKRHNTSHLAIFPFKKISRLHSTWARGNLWSNAPLRYNWNMFPWVSPQQLLWVGSLWKEPLSSWNFPWAWTPSFGMV